MQPTRSIEEWTDQIRRDIAEHRVFIYAKGEKNAAVCGFSRRAMEVFNRLEQPFEARSIFSDPNLRPALTAFSGWPRIPQIFIDGEFVGGSDIVNEMYESGELAQRLGARP